MGHVIWTAFHTSWHSQSLLTGNKAILRLLHHITSILDFYIIRLLYPPLSMSGNSCRSLTSNPAGIWKNCWQLPMIKGYVYFWKTWLAFQNQKQMLPAIFRQMTCGWNKGLNSEFTITVYITYSMSDSDRVKICPKVRCCIAAYLLSTTMSADGRCHWQCILKKKELGWIMG